MAIKIKKKGAEDSDGPEIVDEDVAVQQEIVGSDFRSRKSGNILEDNPQAILWGIGALVAAIICVYFGMEFMEGKRVESSAELTPAYEKYAALVKGSKDFEAISKNEDLPTPTNVVESEKAKWEGIYETSSKTMDANKGESLERTARLTKAAAAMHLGKHDEAETLYDAALKSAKSDVEKLAAYQGLLTVHSTKKAWDKALTQLEAIEAIDVKLVKGVRYEKARVLQEAGKVEDAKTIFHAILEDEPMHPKKSDIERRLATL